MARPPRDAGLAAGALVDAAFRHGVLSALAARPLPGDGQARRQIERLVSGLRVDSAARRAALDDVLRTLEVRGIAACPLKGTFLAERLYPDPPLRPGGDLDVLVVPRDVEPAVQALEARGWTLDRGLAERHARRHGHHLTLFQAGRPALELHFRPLSGFASDLPADEILGRARPGRTGGGAPALVLAPEDELVVLALHALHHHLRRAGWALDLLLFLDAHPALDWDAVWERGARWRCRRALAHALLLLHDLGAPVPVREAAGRRARLAERLRSAILARPRGKIRTALGIAFDGLLADGVPGALRTAAHDVAWSLRLRAHRALHGERPRVP